MSKILLTGASGYIGKKLLRRLLSERSESIIIPLRASGSENFELRKNNFLSSFSKLDQDRIQIIESELSQLSESLKFETNALKVIIHNAAKTAFNVDEETANTVNRDSSFKLLDFAKECAHLEQFLYVSTLYTSGLSSGLIKESFFEKPNFANHYERSKWEVENEIRMNYVDLPWRIGRVATVISDDVNGRVVQQNAIHNTLKLFYYGLISLLPGSATTPIHLVDGDFVTQALSNIINLGENHKIYHVCYGQDAAIKLGQMIDIAFSEFNKDESFKSRRLLKPLFTDEKSFDVLVSNVQGFGGSVLNQGLSSISPFGRQLFVNKEIENSSLMKLMNFGPSVPIEEIVKRSCEFLAQTKFAKLQE